jgi:hypothetical protein
MISPYVLGWHSFEPQPPVTLHSVRPLNAPLNVKVTSPSLDAGDIELGLDPMAAEFPLGEKAFQLG